MVSRRWLWAVEQAERAACETEKTAGRAKKALLVCISLSVGLWKCSIAISCMYFFLELLQGQKLGPYFNYFIFSQWSHLPDFLFWLFSTTSAKQKFSRSCICIKGLTDFLILAEFGEVESCRSRVKLSWAASTLVQSLSTCGWLNIPMTIKSPCHNALQSLHCRPGWIII